MLQATAEHPAIAKMRPIVDSTVKHYRSDFDRHDVLALANLDPSESFVWSVRESGTWLFSPSLIAQASSSGWQGFARVFSARGAASDTDIYLWNGRTFRRIDLEAAYANVVDWEIGVARAAKR